MLLMIQFKNYHLKFKYVSLDSVQNNFLHNLIQYEEKLEER